MLKRYIDFIKENNSFDWNHFQSIVSDFMQPMVDDLEINIEYDFASYHDHLDLLTCCDIDHCDCVLAICGEEKNTSIYEKETKVLDYIESKKDIQHIFGLKVKVLSIKNDEESGICVLFYPESTKQI